MHVETWRLRCCRLLQYWYLRCSYNEVELQEIEPGTFCLAELHHQDQKRVHKPKFKAQEETQKKRKIRRLWTKNREYGQIFSE